MRSRGLLVYALTFLCLCAPAFAWTHGTPQSYTGLVATRSYQPNSFASSAFSTWLMSRTLHFARDTIVNPTLVYGNFYVPNNTNQETVVGTGTVKTAIEYPLGGTITLCGGGAVSFPNGLTSISCTVSITKGDEFAVRTLVTNANGTPYTAMTAWVTGDGATNGTGAASDLVTSGTVPQANASSALFPPVAIVASTLLPGVCIHGDSRSYGSQETATDASGDTGDTGRSIGPSFAYTKLDTNGALLSDYLTSHAIRDQIMAYCSHAIDAYGFNDRAAGQSAATVAANRAVFAALYPRVIVLGTTIYNSTSSTDSWATLVNQTINSNDPASLNVLIRAGIVGERFVFDVAKGIDPGLLGKFPVTGAAFYATPDGIHLTNAGSLIVQSSGVVNPLMIVR